jgi:glycosyltransferase involved in cell wall biosynthesis
MLVFGVGPDAAALRDIAEHAKNVVWLGELDADGLSEVLTKAAVGVVMGRRWDSRTSNEGTPTLALEMLAAGCYPVVGRDAGEAPRIIGDVLFGEVCDQQPTAERLADLAGTWFRPALESERRRVRALMESRFSWETVAAEIRDFYRSCLVLTNGSEGA